MRDQSPDFLKPSESSPLGEDGRTPLRGTPPQSTAFRRSKDRMKDSTYYGILLYILIHRREFLSENQIVWIVYRSRKLNIFQLQRSSKILARLESEMAFFLRLEKEINRIHLSVPGQVPPRLTEKRRIGTGYHDKGSLRPLHQRRDFGEDSLYLEDVLPFIPFDQIEEEGRWITAEEVVRLAGRQSIELVAIQLGVNLTQTVLAITNVENPGSWTD